MSFSVMSSRSDTCAALGGSGSPCCAGVETHVLRSLHMVAAYRTPQPVLQPCLPSCMPLAVVHDRTAVCTSKGPSSRNEPVTLTWSSTASPSRWLLKKSFVDAYIILPFTRAVSGDLRAQSHHGQRSDGNKQGSSKHSRLCSAQMNPGRYTTVLMYRLTLHNLVKASLVQIDWTEYQRARVTAGTSTACSYVWRRRPAAPRAEASPADQVNRDAPAVENELVEDASLAVGQLVVIHCKTQRRRLLSAGSTSPSARSRSRTSFGRMPTGTTYPKQDPDDTDAAVFG